MENSNVLREQKIVIIGCVNPELTEKIRKLVEEDNGGEVVLTHPASVYDYLESKGEETTRSKRSGDQRLSEFLDNPKNRLQAQEQALTLWNIVTDNAPVEEAQNRVISKSFIQKKTTLKDYSDINELLEFLRAFGFIEYTKENATYEFKMIFGKEVRKASARVEIVENIAKINSAVAKYKAILKSDFKNADEEIEKELKDIKKDIDNLIEF